MPVICHVTSVDAWNEAKTKGFYEHPSLKEEGFIHCSEDRQVSGVLSRYFEGQINLIKLLIDTEKLGSRLVFDWSPSSADTFPHVYGPINLDAVIEIVPV
ncbi:MAG TPA: DUF952 domain-containing protein [Chitinophagaceae bacterium]|nr:DUF952 domain-containing protein [Chitinophagaceae bacterium]